MRGIHLSSLMFWQDYIKDKKPIQTSDIGDLYHSILIPYCNIAIVDNSRFDTCDKLKNEIEKYIKTKILNKREILKII